MDRLGLVDLVYLEFLVVLLPLLDQLDPLDLALLGFQSNRLDLYFLEVPVCPEFLVDRLGLLCRLALVLLGFLGDQLDPLVILLDRLDQLDLLVDQLDRLLQSGLLQNLSDQLSQ